MFFLKKIWFQLYTHVHTRTHTHSLKRDGRAVPCTRLPKHSHRDAPEAILAIVQRSLSVIPPGHTENTE